MLMSGTDVVLTLTTRLIPPATRQQSSRRMGTSSVVQHAAASHWAACPCLPSADWLVPVCRIPDDERSLSHHCETLSCSCRRSGELGFSRWLVSRGQLTSSGLILHSSLKPVPVTLFVNSDPYLRVHLSGRDPLGSWLKSTSFISESWSTSLSAATSH